VKVTRAPFPRLVADLVQDDARDGCRVTIVFRLPDQLVASANTVTY
jgi:hypothetical protein